VTAIIICAAVIAYGIGRAIAPLRYLAWQDRTAFMREEAFGRTVCGNRWESDHD